MQQTQQYNPNQPRKSSIEKKTIIKQIRKKYKHRIGYKNHALVVCFEVCFYAVVLAMLGTAVFIIFKQMIHHDLDEYQQTKTFQNFEELGRVNLFNDTSVLPFIEFKLIKKLDPKEYDIYKDINISDPKTNSSKGNVWDVQWDLDINKLKKYFQVYFSYRETRNRVSSYIMDSFRECKEPDFTDRKYYDIKRIGKISSFFCPNIERVSQYAYLQNDYVSENRDAVSIDMTICQGPSCESQDKIKTLCQSIIVNMYYLGQVLHFTDPENLMQKPTVQNVHFYNQFMLRYDIYKDSNNFIRLNNINTRDRRWLNQFQKNHFIFYDIYQKSSWNSESLYDEINVSLDLGKTYMSLNRTLVSGTYFFLSDQVLEHERTVYSIETMMSDVGGLLSILITIIPVIFAITTQRFKMGKIIQYVFTTKMSQHGLDEKDKNNIMSQLSYCNDASYGKLLQFKQRYSRHAQFIDKEAIKQLGQDLEQTNIQVKNQENVSDSIYENENNDIKSSQSSSVSSESSDSMQDSYTNKAQQQVYLDMNESLYPQKLLKQNGQNNQAKSIKQIVKGYQKDETNKYDESAINNIYDEVNRIYEYDKSELKFTFMDLMSNSIIFKIFKPLIEKSGLVKNYQNYQMLTRLIEDDNSFENRLLRYQQIKKLSINIGFIMDNLDNLNIIINNMIMNNPYLLKKRCTQYQKTNKQLDNKNGQNKPNCAKKSQKYRFSYVQNLAAKLR